MLFKNFKFIKSASKPSEFLDSSLTQIALVGRSNVGKSSLINMMANNSKMAKTSQTPGRTRLVNYFNVDEKFMLVDLPGYGFAQASKTMKESWDKVLDDYFLTMAKVEVTADGDFKVDEENRILKMVLVLLDSRRTPSPLDVMMIDYLSQREVPFRLVLTKVDKLNKTDLFKQKKAIASALRYNVDDLILTSAEKKQGVTALEELIEKVIK